MTRGDINDLLPDTEDKVKATYQTLSEKDGRRYVATLSLILPHGGCTYLAELVGCDRSTITRGRKELNELSQQGDPAQGRVRREGAGRPKKDDAHPELRDELENILDERTAGDPKVATVNWTFLTVAAIARVLTDRCVSVSWPVVKRLCKERHLKKRKQVPSVTMSPSRNRDEQFQIIDRLRSLYRQAKDAVFSIDSKEKEMLGNVMRNGEVLADGPVETLDHPLRWYSDGELITHGIYDTQRNTAHMNLSLGRDTGAFSCASFLWFWNNVGRFAHQLADRILLLMDCGGSNSNRSNIFKHNLLDVSESIGLPIQVAHYPVYCSKYNPNERRAFPRIEAAYSGQIFTSPSQMVTAIEKQAGTTTGFEATAHILEKQYKPATTAEKQRAEDVSVHFPENLDEYNYRVAPDLRQ